MSLDPVEFDVNQIRNEKELFRKIYNILAEAELVIESHVASYKNNVTTRAVIDACSISYKLANLVHKAREKSEE